VNFITATSVDAGVNMPRVFRNALYSDSWEPIAAAKTNSRCNQQPLWANSASL